MSKLLRLDYSHTPSKTNGEFRSLIKYLYEATDAEELNEVYIDRDECRMTYLMQITPEVADEVEKQFNLGVMLKNQLIGDWLLELSRTDSNGLHWGEVYDIVRAEKKTETITVTKWKPICDESPVQCSSEQPQSKVCLPQQ